jgi:hypothetical protein
MLCETHGTSWIGNPQTPEQERCQGDAMASPVNSPGGVARHRHSNGGILLLFRRLA